MILLVPKTRDGFLDHISTNKLLEFLGGKGNRT